MALGEHGQQAEPSTGLGGPGCTLKRLLGGGGEVALFRSLTVSVAALSAPGKEICYQPFGCFPDDKPWAGIFQRPVKLFPWAPKDIDTQFLLYTNENPNNFQVRAGMTGLRGAGWWWMGAPTLAPARRCLRKRQGRGAVRAMPPHHGQPP